MAMMIQKFHKLIGSKVVWVCFLLFVCVAFVGLYIPGVADYNQQVQAAAAGTLDGEPVDQEDFRSHYFNCYLRVTMTSLRTPNITDEVDRQLRAMAWRRLVSMREADKLGLTASKEEIVSHIKNLPVFNQGGGYSPAQYNGFVQAILSPLGINEVQFERHIEEEIILQKLAFMVSQGALVPPSELTRRYNMIRDRFTVEYVTIEPGQVEESVTVTDEDGQAYLEANPEAFRIPEKVAVDVVQFDVNDFLDEVEAPAEEDIQAFYDANQAQFGYIGEEPIPQEELEALNLEEDSDVELEPLDFSTDSPEEGAEEELAEAEEEGEPLAEESADTKDDVAEAEEDEAVSEEAGEEELAEAEEEGEPVAEESTDAKDEVAEAEEDEAVSEEAAEEETAEAPAEPEMRKVAKTKSLEEVRDEIVSILLKQKARNLASDKATDLVVALAPNRDDVAASFEDVAKEMNLTTTSLSPFSEYEQLMGLGTGARFNSAAFALEDNQDQYFSDAIIGEHAVYVLKLKERFPSRVPAFEEVRESVMEAARAQAIDDAVYKKADDLVAQAKEELKGGKSFAQSVSRFNVKPETTEPFTAATGLLDVEFSDLLLRAIIVLNQGEITEPIPTTNGAVIAYVSKREEGDPAGFGTIRDQLTQTLRQRQAQTLVQTWQDYLLEEAGFVDHQEQALSEEEEPPEEEAGDAS